MDNIRNSTRFVDNLRDVRYHLDMAMQKAKTADAQTYHGNNALTDLMNAIGDVMDNYDITIKHREIAEAIKRDAAA